MSRRPLDDIRVLDLGHYLAGPLVGMMLADMGAEVIRVDPPGGPVYGTPAARMFARGKSAVELDLKSGHDRDVLLSLVRRSDVLVENFRPGVMARLGLDWEVLRQANADLICLSLPGFASGDAGRRHLPAWEAVIAASTGQFTDMGLNRRLMGISPSFTPLTLASAYGAAFGAMSVLFALGARPHNGGDRIEVPLASALLEGLSYNCERIENYPDRYKSPRELEIERRGREGLPMDLDYGDLTGLLDPFYRTYICADGRGFYVVAGSVVSHPRRVLETLGLEGLLEELPDFDAYLDTDRWPAPWSLRNYPVGPDDRERITAAMQRAFLRRPAHEWEALFGAAKAPATMQRWTSEWLADPHSLASGLIVTVEDAGFGPMRQMGNVAWLGSDAGVLQKSPAPDVRNGGGVLERVLAEPPREPAGAEGATGWLEGIRVLDLTNVIAGPTIASTLSRFGAEVIHVQPVHPSVDPWNTVVFGLQANRGKESILLDLGTGRGREVLDRLIRRTDVITFNGTDEQRDRLGLNPGRLQGMNPALILAQLDAFGGPARGPKSDHLGYDDLAQAATGVMLRFGGSMETPEEHAHFGTIDVLAGYCACVAIGAALHRRGRTGRGDLARASLAAAGNLIQAPFMFDFDGRGPFDEPAGRKALGWGPYYHCYRAADGWMFFAAPGEREAVLSRVPELADLAALPEDSLGEALASRFSREPIAYWAESLTGTSSAAVPLATLMQIRDGALELESDGGIDLERDTFRVIRHDRHPMGRWVDLVAPNAVRPGKGRVTIPGPMPKYGAQTVRILRDLGYDHAEVKELLAEGVAGERWSSRYLPE